MMGLDKLFSKPSQLQFNYDDIIDDLDKILVTLDSCRIDANYQTHFDVVENMVNQFGRKWKLESDTFGQVILQSMMNKISLKRIQLYEEIHPDATSELN